MGEIDVLRVNDIKECFQVIITLGKDEKDALRSQSIAYKYRDMNGELNGECFHLPDDIDIFNAVYEVIKRAQDVIGG